MVSRAVVLIALMVPGSAWAQSWTVCIDPASGGPTSEGFRTLRDVASAASASRHGYLNYRFRRSSLGPRGEPPPVRVIDIELRRAGARGWITPSDEQPHADVPVGDQACFEILAQEGAPGLSHYYGPYFPLGSAVIPEAQRPSLEYLVLGYQPGVTLFLVDGFADTRGSTESNTALAARRTEAVAHELVRLGVRWDDIVQRALGETLLARPTADGVAEPLNRRVSIDVRQRPPPEPH